jgi:putative DNA primase/helicase
MTTLSAIAHALGAKRNGSQWVARCVSHEDQTPSMALRTTPDGRLLVKCHAGCAQESILAALKERGLWSSVVTDCTAFSMRSTDAERTAKAREVWQHATSATGTLVETYLRARAITLPPPPTLRFISDAYHGESGQALPALIAAVTVWPSQAVCAVQRIFLRYDGSGKAAVSPAKKSLGPIRGGAVRLAKVGTRLGIAEGIEDALSAMQLDPTLPAWATLGTANFMTVVLPPLPLAAEVVIIADNDGPGLKTANDAAKRFRAEGRTVRIARPPQGTKDFNEALQQQAARGAA